MFKTLVMLCAIAQPNQCVLFEDTTGPQETMQDCYQRAVEMEKGLAPLFPVPMMARFKCEKLNGA
jgi:hypothetical protein